MPAPIRTQVQSSSFHDYQFHQVAMYTRYPEPAVKFWKDRGHTEWIHDEARLRGYITDPHTGWVYQSAVLAEMWFNYTVQPMELEFLTYHQGTSRHSLANLDKPGRPFISHMSVYCDDIMEEIGKNLELDGAIPYHRFVTNDHTNPGVVGKKRFIEAIYDTRDGLGYDVKYIQKVPWDFDDLSYLHHEMFDDWKECRDRAFGEHNAP